MTWDFWKYPRSVFVLWELLSVHARESLRLAVKSSHSINWLSWLQLERTPSWCKANVMLARPLLTLERHPVFLIHTQDHTFDPRDVSSSALVVAELHAVTRNKPIPPITFLLIIVWINYNCAPSKWTSVNNKLQQISNKRREKNFNIMCGSFFDCFSENLLHLVTSISCDKLNVFAAVVKKSLMPKPYQLSHKLLYYSLRLDLKHLKLIWKWILAQIYLLPVT